MLSESDKFLKKLKLNVMKENDRGGTVWDRVVGASS